MKEIQLTRISGQSPVSDIQPFLRFQTRPGAAPWEDRFRRLAKDFKLNEIASLTLKTKVRYQGGGVLMYSVPGASAQNCHSDYGFASCVDVASCCVVLLNVALTRCHGPFSGAHQLETTLLCYPGAIYGKKEEFLRHPRGWGGNRRVLLWRLPCTGSVSIMPAR